MVAFHRFKAIGKYCVKSPVPIGASVIRCHISAHFSECSEMCPQLLECAKKKPRHRLSGSCHLPPVSARLNPCK